MVEKFDMGGKSGCPLYITHDSRFIVKLLLDEEFHFMAYFARKYVEYTDKHPCSILLKIYGLYTIKMRSVQKSFGFIAMGNITPSTFGLVQKYDLKGSTYGRTERKSAVSYTHLRAHETPEHLVCRLLLEKKKKTHIQ
eukprot:TRINITY_DN36845_c0_g1_i2.p1 TRINITY_DN36845_c0_g1~~TRINITY_DN36845_c0_g1_i2.p1  ORF type:complete len:138 (-),score=25.71 TRINITY_DN36845_c0_g1_i2:97-510(-)